MTARLLLIISGGQTGVDQAALRAALAAGIPTGGEAPLGWATETGPAPELARFGLLEGSGGYSARTAANVRMSHGTLLMGDRESRGSLLTLRMCQRYHKPWHWTPWRQNVPVDLHTIVAWLEREEITTLNVAGNRESYGTGIGLWAERTLRELFTLTNGKGEIE